MWERVVQKVHRKGIREDGGNQMDREEWRMVMYRRIERSHGTCAEPETVVGLARAADISGRPWRNGVIHEP